MSGFEVDTTLPKDAISVTCTAPVNIAVIKYWGKRDEKLILPINSSLSGTIDQSAMRSKTTITASKTFTEDTMTLNAKPVDFKSSSRLNAVYEAILQRAQDVCDEDGTVLVAKDDWKNYRIKVESENNFPTAAGLASSASGLACFTFALATLFGVKETYPGELSSIARTGSGSACRSLYGGWGRWIKGERPDGHDSVASQVADEHHWPEMRVLILVAHGGQKEVSSTSGMETTVLTSPLIQHRAATVVDERMKLMEEAILTKNFKQFAEVTMKDSNQFHATCLDTYPPIFYLNPTSQRIIRIVHLLNDLAEKQGQEPVAAYTFDAGPNAVIYCLDKNLQPLLSLFSTLFKPADQSEQDWISDPAALTYVGQSAEKPNVDGEWLTTIGENLPDHRVYNVFVSKLGPGPQVVEKKRG